jgi:hypothetical protein
MVDHTQQNQSHVDGYWDADGLLSIRNGNGAPLSRGLLLHLGLGDDDSSSPSYVAGFRSRLEEFDQDEAAAREDRTDSGDVVNVATWTDEIAKLKPGAKISLVMGNDPPGNLSISIDGVRAVTAENELEITVSITDEEDEEELPDDDEDADDAAAPPRASDA